MSEDVSDDGAKVPLAANFEPDSTTTTSVSDLYTRWQGSYLSYSLGYRLHPLKAKTLNFLWH